MPSGEDEVRVVIDETSFDFREPFLTGRLEVFLDRFNDELRSLRADGVVVWRMPDLDSVECHEEHGLYDFFLAGPGREIDPDTYRLFMGLTDKCLEWDESVPECFEVSLPGEGLRTAFSVAFALTSALHGRGVACLVFPACGRRGFVPVGGEVGQAELYFFNDAKELPVFWRSLYRLENVGAADFFTLAVRAFPRLIFHPALSFSRFKGSYLERRDAVVAHLSALNDEFLGAHEASLGKASDVEVRLSHVGWHGISTESAKTHRDARAMRQRCVEHEGQEVLCEWHTKVTPTSDRIHFAFGGGLADRILIGFFVDHFKV